MEMNGYLINELSQGMEMARQLRGQMGAENSAETIEILLQQIVSSYDKALSILGCAAAPAEQPPHQLSLVHSPAVPSSPSSNVGSPNANDLSMRSNINQAPKQCALKRKSASTWTKQFKLNPENGLDGPPDDGYSWRKYGQKDILGAKNPRSYYRCTYRNVQDCCATRQVQRSEKDPTVFDITYRGKHTCNMIRRSKSAPTSPAKQDPKQHNEAEYQQDSATDFMFQTNNADVHNNVDSFPSMEIACVKSESASLSTSTLNNNNNNNSSSSRLYGNMCTSGSNYFPMSACNLDSIANVQHQQSNLEVDIADMIFAAAATSSTNSPTIDPDFMLNPWSFDPDFPFNDPGFFSLAEHKGSF